MEGRYIFQKAKAVWLPHRKQEGNPPSDDCRTKTGALYPDQWKSVQEMITFLEDMFDGDQKI